MLVQPEEYAKAEFLSSKVFAVVDAGVGVAETGVLASVGVGVGKITLVGVAVGWTTGAEPISEANTFKGVLPHFCKGLI